MRLADYYQPPLSADFQSYQHTIGKWSDCIYEIMPATSFASADGENTIASPKKDGGASGCHNLGHAAVRNHVKESGTI